MDTNRGAASLKDFDESNIAAAGKMALDNVRLQAALDALKAENARLRKALAAILLIATAPANPDWHMIKDSGLNQYKQENKQMRIIAREALQQEV